MAAYTDYQHQHQPVPSANDFTLYPQQDLWMNQHAAQFVSNTYPDQSYNTRSSMIMTKPQPSSHLYQEPLYDFEVPKSGNSPSTSTSNSTHQYQAPALSSYSDTGASVSSISSATASPALHPQIHNEWYTAHDMAIHTHATACDSLGTDMYMNNGYILAPSTGTEKGCVDPALIQPYSPASLHGIPFPDPHMASPQAYPYVQAPSPAPSRTSIRSPRVVVKRDGSAQPFLNAPQWQPFSAPRHSSASPAQSPHSSHGSFASEESNKGLCPIPTCGRHVKDLKAHMATHSNDRPEKCPIPTCEYSTKGFARKYDKNRHTLTHYKGTMICDFCPGSGSAAEKSFNRADVFKRHLTTVHGVEQTPTNARRKQPAGNNGSTKRAFHGIEASGTCSTCRNTFASAQELYEHLDECVLAVVKQIDPSESINEALLSSLADDSETRETLEKHSLPTEIDYSASTSFDDDEADDDEDTNMDAAFRSIKSGKGVIKARKGDFARHATQHFGNGKYDPTHGAISKSKRGMTLSKGGVALVDPLTKANNRRRKNYPVSWTAAPAQMKMRKRVLCVFDGARRLWKDDMMLDAEHEVRVPLPGVEDGRAWVTDLDKYTIARADAFHNATEAEKGSWAVEDAELERLMQ